MWCVAVDEPVYAEAEQTDDQQVEDQVAHEGEQGFVSYDLNASQGVWGRNVKAKVSSVLAIGSARGVPVINYEATRLIGRTWVAVPVPGTG